MDKESKLFLKEKPTIQDFQKYVLDLENERGFTKDVLKLPYAWRRSWGII